ncbi:MAG: flagellar assembly peptidoglycan hydrolase FlgJ [Gammaproteobacteria bacterium]|nr:flagellar assembly peptidoglycan hydrolase FlgJ [Gammaproteobacteria bacterium]
MITTYSQTQFETAQIYHDANSLSNLKLKGKDDSPETIREVAKQFESIFTGMMLKSMRDANAAIIDEPLLDSAQLGMYQDMYDEQLSLHLSSSNGGSGLGLTEVLVKQLSGLTNTNNYPDKVTSKLNLSERVTSHIAPVVNTNTETSVPGTVSGIVSGTEVEKIEERGLDFSSPSAFVKSLWPYAERAAQSLQLDPKVLIAQAALETGWGKHVMKTEQGASSKNLFGIKANHNWQGERAQVTTLELDGDSLKKQRADFRAYDSYADSFEDYTRFITDRTRYQTALDVAADPKKYAEELQTAGYATDPNYAEKIQGIFNSPILKNAINALVDISGTGISHRMTKIVGG